MEATYHDDVAVPDLTGDEWALLGVLVTIAVAIAGWIGSAIGRRRSRRSDASLSLVFGAVYLFRPGEHPREGYGYALGISIKNIGPGTAINILTKFQGETAKPGRPVLSTEGITTNALGPDQGTSDFLGVRYDPHAPGVVPTEAEVKRFMEEGTLTSLCWDTLGRPYEFTPAGGGRLSRREAKALVSRSEAARRTFDFPSFGDRPQSFGAPKDHL